MGYPLIRVVLNVLSGANWFEGYMYTIGAYLLIGGDVRYLLLAGDVRYLLVTGVCGTDWLEAMSGTYRLEACPVLIG